MNELAPKESDGEFLLYQTEDGQVKLEVRLQNETVWLTQQMMAELFRTSKQNISHHIHGIYEEGELQPEATVKKYLTVRREGNRDIRRELDFYNLDMIISVGYRVKSLIATRFPTFKDAGFADDSVKTNPVQILRQAGIDDVKSL